MAQNSEYFPWHYDPNSGPSPPPARINFTGQHQGAAADNRPLQRASSFDAGDDAPFVRAVEDRNGGNYGQASAGRTDAHQRGDIQARYRHDELFLGDQVQPPSSPQYRMTSSQVEIATGYHHQYQPASAPPTQSTYNPQQFAWTQPQQASQIPITQGSLNAYRHQNRGSVVPVSHQPYNPAAYRAPGTSQQSSAFALNGHDLTSIGSVSPPIAPVPHLPHQDYFETSPQPQLSTIVPSSHSLSHHSLAQLPPFPNPAEFPLPPLPPLPSPAAHRPISQHHTAYSAPAPPPPPVPPMFQSYASGDYQQSPSLSEYPFSPDQRSNERASFSTVDRRPSPSMPNHGAYDSTSSTPSPLPPAPPQHIPQRTSTLDRHPQSRPLPGPPPDLDYPVGPRGAVSGPERYASTEEEMAQEAIYKELEEAMMSGPSHLASQRRTPGYALHVGPPPDGREAKASFRPYSRSPSPQSSVATPGHVPSTGADAYSDESDAEAAAGLAAMRVAEEQEAADNARRASGCGGPMFGSYGAGSSSNARLPFLNHDGDLDHSDFGMALHGGGYDDRMPYDDGGSTAASPEEHRPPAVFSLGRPLPPAGTPLPMGGPSWDGSKYDYAIPDQDAIHPFPSFNSAARVDTDGTGGLAEPSQYGRRRSFDEGDELTWDRRSGSRSPSKEDIPEMFYFPGASMPGGATGDRPLPVVPARLDVRAPRHMSADIHRYDQRVLGVDHGLSYPIAPDHYRTMSLDVATLAVPRSTSLTSHSSSPQAITPARSKTDAEERKARFLKQAGMPPPLPVTHARHLDSGVILDLPAIPAGKRKRFNPAKLSPPDYQKCSQPWALSALATWLREMTDSETEVDLREQVLMDGIIALFTYKVPTMNIADAETLGARAISQMFVTGTLVHDEEWVKFGPAPISGVIWQLTGSGCYAPLLHNVEMPGRCYSHNCSRTLKKINLQTQILEPERKLEDWATFYKLKKEDLEGRSKKEVERQNNLHEIVQTEDQYTDQLNVLRVLYRDQLTTWQPPIIHPDRIRQFAEEVFGKVDAVIKVNEDHLLAQLKYRQQEQGPWIVGFSDIFREWIRKAKAAYTEYAACFPNATLIVRKEAERNLLFRQFLDQARENEWSKRLGWDTYLKAPITRLQRYGLLLYTVHKNMVVDTEEKMNLQIAMDEIKAVTLECDARVAEMSKKVDLVELGSKLILRPGMERVELNLNHLGRELIFKGDLQRTGANRFTWLETHGILFDHYLVLAKTVHQRESPGAVKQERYDVSKLPIPMDLLVLESTNDDPVVKSSVKGLGAVTTVTRAQTAADVRSGRNNVPTLAGPGTLTQTSTSASLQTMNSISSTKNSMTSSTVLEGSKDEKVMYPFRIKHLGQDTYTLYAPSASNRDNWCEKILEAKKRHAASLFEQNAEPFRLRVMADTAFAYDSLTGGPRSPSIEGTPLDRALREVDLAFKNSGPRPHPVCRASINCATSFKQPYPGKPVVAVGTDYGVFLSDMENPRGWTRAIAIGKVSQVAVLEELGLFLLIADKSLIAYHLDVICSVAGGNPGNDSARKAPQKLSGSREVGFFTTGRMKERALVFYKKREGLSSTFKVLEPVFQKSTEKKSRFSRKGMTEFFRDYDEFYIPTECFSINLFHSWLAVSTARGFEVLTLDKKQGLAIPDLKAPHVASIAARLAGQRPLAMFRLNDTEFLLCYEECAVYVNKHGDVNRVLIMEFVGKAKSAAMYGPYILLFDADFVEVRNAENGRLKQVIAGRDIKCLDDARPGASIAGVGPGRTVKIAMQHPEAERIQLVVELLLNDGQIA